MSNDGKIFVDVTSTSTDYLAGGESTGAGVNVYSRGDFNGSHA